MIDDIDNMGFLNDIERKLRTVGSELKICWCYLALAYY